MKERNNTYPQPKITFRSDTEYMNIWHDGARESVMLEQSPDYTETIDAHLNYGAIYGQMTYLDNEGGVVLEPDTIYYARDSFGRQRE